MKKYILFFVVFHLFGIQSHAQWDQVEDYTSKIGWQIVDLDEFGNTVTPPRININTLTGICEYNTTIDGKNETYISKQLDSALCTSWMVETEFEIRNIFGNSQKPIEEVAHIILVLSSNSNVHPWRDFKKQPTFSDFIAVQLTNDVPGLYYIEPFIGENGVKHEINSSCKLQVFKNVKYRIRLERISESSGFLTLFSADSTIIDECCLQIPETLDPLVALQHSNNPQGSYRRNLTASIFETRIAYCTNNGPCNFSDKILGPDSLCIDNLPATFWVNSKTTSLPYWELLSTISNSGLINDSITIYDLNILGDTLELILTEQCGCVKNILKKTVKLFKCEEECELIVPNVFTPQNDGINDYFRISDCTFNSFEMIIFNRWGGMVYKSNDPNAAWDGKYLDSPCAEGVYFLLIKGEKSNLENINVQKAIHLFR